MNIDLFVLRNFCFTFIFKGIDSSFFVRFQMSTDLVNRLPFKKPGKIYFPLDLLSGESSNFLKLQIDKSYYSIVSYQAESKTSSIKKRFILSFSLKGFLLFYFKVLSQLNFLCNIRSNLNNSINNTVVIPHRICMDIPYSTVWSGNLPLLHLICFKTFLNGTTRTGSITFCP